jgi:hypothetical protein
VSGKALSSRVAVGSGTLPHLPNAASVEDRSRPIYFLHVPKTAGTTFHGFLSAQFDVNAVCPAHLWHQMIRMTPEEVETYSFIWGHFYAYLHRHVPAPMHYVTLVRDPVERALSHYGHIMLHPQHYLHARARQAGSFGAYLRDPELATTLNNFQVRSYSVDLDPKAIASRLPPMSHGGLELERALETAAPTAPIDYLLGIARRRLEQMCFVGITERLDESVRLACHTFGWQAPRTVDVLNANSERPRAIDISAADRTLLRELNAADYELYEHATRLFEEALSHMRSQTGPSFG